MATSAIQDSIKSLSRQYYIRNFLFGLIFPSILYMGYSNGDLSAEAPPVFLAVLTTLSIISTILYPYSRFLYETFIAYFTGNNTFYGNAFVVLFCKFFTMALCWAFAIIIAPFSLIYLHLKIEDQYEISIRFSFDCYFHQL
jgi:hypothetical protein